ncbi:YHS domain-containing (seleno)protein [Terasakiella sp. A23]|uniref:YHS domain-containing (seleno)protein n=1 Tax=Terasakiella sp. FCG-A23 TaxID=3080561 RepID=UPI002952DBC2|nr:YHS domain-containing (seleno)protein [Terasakiella sp. A23]MDV7341530.1 YHS domain-containing (seleno)protein [Terasakiella sp. A23]
MMKAIKILSAAVVVAGLSAGGAAFTSPAYAGADPVYTGYLSNVAVEGYDPVAYFIDGKATKGSGDFTMDYQGAEFRFASQKNLDTFKSNPAAYAPQYGGYCAWAVSQGYTAKGDAKHWRIVDGKLYLNYNADVKNRWEGDIPGFIASADKQWPTIIKK